MKKWILGGAAGLIVLGAALLSQGGSPVKAEPSKPAIQFNGSQVNVEAYPDCH